MEKKKVDKKLKETFLSGWPLKIMQKNDSFVREFHIKMI